MQGKQIKRSSEKVEGCNRSKERREREFFHCYFFRWYNCGSVV
jgi:hypothetical protein